jgi:hypothetical protein
MRYDRGGIDRPTNPESPSRGIEFTRFDAIESSEADFDSARTIGAVDAMNNERLIVHICPQYIPVPALSAHPMPPAMPTTSQGGSLQTVSMPKQASASAASSGIMIALVITGVYSVASRMPTTAALWRLRIYSAIPR